MFNPILFDFDGTLADTAQCAVISAQAAFTDMQLEPPSETAIIHSMGVPIERSFHDFGAVHFSDAQFAELLASFRKHYAQQAEQSIRLFDGTRALLSALKTAGKITAIISSKKTDILVKNAQFLGIAEDFDLILGSDKVSAYKPDPAGIIEALAILKLPKTYAIYIGDAVTDIEMAKNAGITACAVTWGAHQPAQFSDYNPDYIIDDFKNLQSLLLTGH